MIAGALLALLSYVVHELFGRPFASDSGPRSDAMS